MVTFKIKDRVSCLNRSGNTVILKPGLVLKEVIHESFLSIKFKVKNEYYYVRKDAISYTGSKSCHENVDVNIDNVRTVILSILRQVLDPEMSFRITDLGLIRDIKIESLDDKACTQFKVNLVVLLTTCWCPFADFIMKEISDSLYTLPSLIEVIIYHDTSTKWHIDMVSEYVKLALNIL